jgi:hypothetical protein
MANPWSLLRSLLPKSSLVEGQVTAITDDGVVTVTTVGGGTLRCTALVSVQTGDNVEVVDQKITQVISELTVYTLQI